jgi:hypothetical protein
VQQKLPTETLTRYHRWIAQSGTEDALSSLHEWLLKEAEFLTIAVEAVKGVAAADASVQTSVKDPKPPEQPERLRTHFISAAERNRPKRSGRSCRICDGQHGVWRCPEFLQMTVSERWSLARNLRLCFKCLAVGHSRKSCGWQRGCDASGCTAGHHRLLHRDRRPETRTMLHGGGDSAGRGRS